MRVASWFRIDRVAGPQGYVAAVLSAGALSLVAASGAVGLNAAMGGAIHDIWVVALIFACITIGLQVFVGSTGIVSFGHVAFVAIGAYSAGLVSVPADRKAALLPKLPGVLAQFQVDYPLSLLFAAVVPALVAAVVGPVLMRLSGQAAAVTSFAFLVIVNDVLRNAKAITNGVQTFSGVPATTTLLHAALALILVTASAAMYKWSESGLRARAVRDSDLAAEAAGISVLSGRLWPWILSAALCGIGGGLWAHFLTAFSPVNFFLQSTVVIIVMLFIGGAMSVTGAVLGAIGVSVWLELARRIEGGVQVGDVSIPAITQFSDISVALILIVLLQLRPNGVVGFREFRLPGLTRVKE